MKRFQSQNDRPIKSELDYNDTKSVAKNIHMKRKKFVPPEKEELRKQRWQLRDLGLLSQFSQTASSYYKSGQSQTSVKSWMSLAKSYMEDLYAKTTPKVDEKEVSIHDAEQR